MNSQSFVRDLEALRVGPDEVLIIRLDPVEFGPDESDPDPLRNLRKHLAAVGLEDRTLLFACFREEIDFLAVKLDGSGVRELGVRD